jgi:hypothetical protein
MAMTWTSLTSPKGTSGSIANWVSYTKLDINPIVDEAQAMIYSRLRTREMLTSTTFLLTQNSSEIALPVRFLDPIGRIRGVDFNLGIKHKDQGYVTGSRTYSGLSGSLGTNPFTTTTGLTTVSVNLTNHGLTQGSTFAPYSVSSVNGISLASQSFPVVSITDANDFVIDTISQTASGSGSGGGSGGTYVANQLITSMPALFAIWDEKIKFDCAAQQDINMVMPYFQSLALLSASNLTNFLTNRYPQLMRVACQAAAADFQKDTTEFQKSSTRLEAMIEQIAIDNDGFMRGIEAGTENPHHGG